MSSRHAVSPQPGSRPQDRTNTLPHCITCRLQSANRLRIQTRPQRASPTAFHQSAHITDHLSAVHDFDVAPLLRVESSSDRRLGLLLASSSAPHRPETASGSRVTSSMEWSVGSYLDGSMSSGTIERWRYYSQSASVAPDKPPLGGIRRYTVTSMLAGWASTRLGWWPRANRRCTTCVT